MGILKLGPLSLKYEWILLFLAGTITYIMVRKLVTNKDFQKEFIDTIFNVVIVWFLVYKFSIILFRPKIILDNPVAVLYFNGGSKGILLAIIVSIAYILWTHKKKSWPSSDLAKALIYSIATFVTSYWLLRTLLLLIW